MKSNLRNCLFVIVGWLPFVCADVRQHRIIVGGREWYYCFGCYWVQMIWLSSVVLACSFVRLCSLFIDIIPSPNIRTRIMEKLCSANFRIFILAWLVWRGSFADSFVATLHSNNNNTTTQLHFPFILFVWVFHVFFLCVFLFYIRLEHPIIAILLLLGRWRLLTELVSTHPTNWL